MTFLTKPAGRGTLEKIDVCRKKQSLYSIFCDSSRCYNGEAIRPLEVRVKEPKHNLWHVEKIEISTTFIRIKTTKYVWN